MVVGRLAIINLPLLCISSQTIEQVNSYKLFGVHIESSLLFHLYLPYYQKGNYKVAYAEQFKIVGLSNKLTSFL